MRPIHQLFAYLCPSCCPCLLPTRRQEEDERISVVASTALLSEEPSQVSIPPNDK